MLDLSKVFSELILKHPELQDELTGYGDLLREQMARAEHLASLLEISAQLNATLDYDRLLRMILDLSCELLNAEASSIFLINEETGDLRMALATTIPPEVARTIRVPRGKGVVGSVVETGETVLVPDVAADPRFYGGVDATTSFVTRSILCVPIRTREVSLDEEEQILPREIIGATEVLNKRVGTFTEEDVRLFQALAAQAAVALETSRLYEELRQTFLGVVGAFAASIDAKDDYTRGHSDRVAEFSVAIGRALSMPRRPISALRLSAILHDVGKIGVPDAVLKKTAPLTTAELDIIRKHSAIGYAIMRKVPALHEVLSGIRDHHEWLDGSGYPGGLTGERISLIARIIGVADAFDAMTSDRVYRPAFTTEEAIHRLFEGAGVQFDPDVVHALQVAYRRGEIIPLFERRMGDLPAPARAPARAARGSRRK